MVAGHDNVRLKPDEFVHERWKPRQVACGVSVLDRYILPVKSTKIPPPHFKRGSQVKIGRTPKKSDHLLRLLLRAHLQRGCRHHPSRVRAKLARRRSGERARRFVRAEGPALDSDGSWRSVEAEEELASDLSVPRVNEASTEGSRSGDDYESHKPDGVTRAHVAGFTATSRIG
jgi:hypothetical protein